MPTSTVWHRFTEVLLTVIFQVFRIFSISLKPGDVRAAANMIGPDPAKVGRPVTNLGKFPSTDYSDEVPVIRYEEVILNYAEALWRLNTADPNALDTS